VCYNFTVFPTLQTVSRAPGAGFGGPRIFGFFGSNLGLFMHDLIAKARAWLDELEAWWSYLLYHDRMQREMLHSTIRELFRR
jgi:hypothetical protein